MASSDDYHELAALLGNMYQTVRSIMSVWLAEGRVQRLPEGGARNIKLTDDMQAITRDEQEKLYNSLSPPSPHWSGTGGSLPRNGNFKLNHSPAPSKPTHHHQNFWKGQRCTV